MRSSPAALGSLLLCLFLLAGPVVANGAAGDGGADPSADLSGDLSSDISSNLSGNWVGTLHAGQSLRLVLHIIDGPEGLIITMDSVDQGAMGLSTRDITVRGDSLSFKLRDIPAGYRGMLTGQDSLEGQWEQGMNLPLNFTRGDTLPTLDRPQDPHPPFPYVSEEVLFSYDPARVADTLEPGKSADPQRITLAGTLTLPQGDGPHPAVLLITGSGPQDRDESLMGHRPFLVLADHLTRHGLAVLRVDDRGTARSTGDFAAATSADFAVDAGAALLFLQQHRRIASDRVALLGHSEGGLVAPMVATAHPEVAAIVVMAGPGVPGKELLQEQQKLILEAMKLPAPDIARAQEHQRAVLELLGGNLEGAEFQAAWDGFLQEAYDKLTPAEKTEISGPADLGQLPGPMKWMRFLVKYDPARALAGVHCPVLAVNGEKDLQVPPYQNLPAIAAALKAAGNEDYQTVELPGLNHLFQHCTTGAVAEYGTIEETLAPEFLDLVTAWLQERLGVKGS